MVPDNINQKNKKPRKGRDAIDVLEDNLNPICSMRRFLLIRDEDVSGVSGTGVVAEGVEFTNGWCAMTWHSSFASVTTYASISVVQKVHSHLGKHNTKIVFIDEINKDDRFELLSMLKEAKKVNNKK